MGYFNCSRKILPASLAALVSLCFLQMPARSAEDPTESQTESISADVSARRVAVTASFTGTEVLVFGAIANSKQSSSAAGYYDVVVVVKGIREKLVARKKEHVGGIWINSGSQSFSNVPNYYAISSTRPLDDIASEDVLDKYGIGFMHIHMQADNSKAGHNVSKDALKAFRTSVIRLKKKNGLYIDKPYATAFVSSNLFRSTLHLPANVTVGPFETHVYLFHEGEMLSQHSSKLTLEREGIELMMHKFAFGYPFFYGIFALLTAVSAGLIASQIFKKKT